MFNNIYFIVQNKGYFNKKFILFGKYNIDPNSNYQLYHISEVSWLLCSNRAIFCIIIPLREKAQHVNIPEESHRIKMECQAAVLSIHDRMLVFHQSVFLLSVNMFDL